MCISLRASIASSITSLVTCVILFNNVFCTPQTDQNRKMRNGFKILAMFFLFVSLMQWYDIIFWMNQEKNSVNYAFTKIAMITNHLQPIVFAVLISLYFKLRKETKAVLFTYVICAIGYSMYAYNNIQYTLVTDRSSPVLYWEWNLLNGWSIMYALFLLTLCVLSMELPAPVNYIMLFINVGSFMLSWFQVKREVVGKMWCAIASYIPLILVILECMTYEPHSITM